MWVCCAPIVIKNRNRWLDVNFDAVLSELNVSEIYNMLAELTPHPLLDSRTRSEPFKASPQPNDLVWLNTSEMLLLVQKLGLNRLGARAGSFENFSIKVREELNPLPLHQRTGLISRKSEQYWAVNCVNMHWVALCYKIWEFNKRWRLNGVFLWHDPK